MNPWKLSDEQLRTLQVLTGEAKGLSKLAGRTLGISSHAVDARVAEVCRKMGAANRVEALLLFDRTYRNKVTAIKPAHGVQDCGHCAGLGFVQRSAA